MQHLSFNSSQFPALLWTSLTFTLEELPSESEPPNDYTDLQSEILYNPGYIELHKNLPLDESKPLNVGQALHIWCLGFAVRTAKSHSDPKNSQQSSTSTSTEQNRCQRNW